jgi:5-methylcytosine-specific restriction endonuclease McrA
MNLVNGKIIEITDDEYQHYLPPLSLKIGQIIKIFNGYKLNIVKKVPKSNIYFIDFVKNNSKLNFFVGYLKNSGTSGNDNKRLQIPNKLPNFNSKEKYYCLGIYPNGEQKNIFLISDITPHAQRSKNFTSYSSFWAHFNDILSANKYGKYASVVNKIHNHYYFNDENMDYGYSSLLNLINQRPLVQETEPNILELRDFDINRIKTINSDKLERDSRFREYVINRDGRKCKLCGDDNTFIDRNGESYFEAHHIIPYNLNIQESFKISLDHPFNMITLCPNCHRKIHNSKLSETKSLLSKLLQNNADFTNNYFLNKKIDDLLDFYF